MSYIYHLKPEPFEGTHLIPLNQMPRSSELYRGHAQKYVGREALMEELIPKLDCKWNDVVHFSAISPELIVQELRKLVPELKVIRSHYFKIPINEILNKYETVIFNRKKRIKGSFAIRDEEVMWADGASYQELKEVPSETLNYWREAQANGGKMLWFPFVTHVLVKGTVDTSRFELCELK